MSLKAFHIVFVVAATTLAAGFGMWAIRDYVAGDHSLTILILGIVSLLLGMGLIWYGKYFLRKLKNISYL
jgi:hypothetical protein